MTRKDYVAIARIFRDFRQNQKDLNPGATSRTQFADNILQADFARMLASDNPRFNLDRFNTACKVTP